MGVLDEGDQAGDRTRTPGPGLVDQIRDVDVAAGGDVQDSALRRHLDDERVTLTAAATEGRGTDAATAPLELERQVEGDARAGHANGMAHGDRATVDVDLLRVQTQLLGRRQADSGEGLVDLDEVEVADLDALLRARGRDGTGRLALQGRVGAGDDTVGADLGQPG